MNAPTEQSSTDAQMYCNCMLEVRERISLVLRVFDGFTTEHPAFDAEFCFLQLRKVLETIAFASLIANREQYCAEYENFASHWNAPRMLAALEKINPEFYPVPVNEPELKDGIKHLSLATEAFLTKEDFVILYDKCGKILHAKNPFSTDGPRIPMVYSPKQWVSRIQVLLRLHFTRLINGDVWVIQVPATGDIKAYPSTSFSGKQTSAPPA